MQPWLNNDRADVASVLNASSAIVGERPIIFIVGAAAYTAASAWVELHHWTWRVELALIGTTMLLAGVVQYVILRRVLGPPAQGKWTRVLAPLRTIVIHLLVWIVASFTLVLLVLPGCNLAGRMSAAVGIAAAEGRGVAFSIAESWRRTRRSAWPLTLVQLILSVPLLATYGLVMVWAITQPSWMTWDDASTEIAVLTNVILGVAAMATWAVAIATYRLTTERPPSHDAAIFA